MNPEIIDSQALDGLAPGDEALGYSRALLNILEDIGGEKTHLERTEQAILNILDDLAAEKDSLERARVDLMRSEDALRSSLREKEALLKEVHHRVKNNLQVIASLLRLQSRYVRDEALRAMFEESQGRVRSIALVHEMLYRAPDLARVNFDAYLKALAGHLIEAYGRSGAAIEIMIEAEGVQLAIDAAIPCGLIVTELVTNSLKHAFPKAASGSIWVHMAREPDGRTVLRVQDNGAGLPQDFDVGCSETLGLELVATLVRQLRGAMEVRGSPGATFLITFPTVGVNNGGVSEGTKQDPDCRR